MAIDCHKNTYAVICGHGKPSASRIFEALKNHIVSGSTLMHDGEKVHDKLTKELTYLTYRVLVTHSCNEKQNKLWFCNAFVVIANG